MNINNIINILNGFYNLNFKSMDENSFNDKFDNYVLYPIIKNIKDNKIIYDSSYDNEDAIKYKNKTTELEKRLEIIRIENETYKNNIQDYKGNIDNMHADIIELKKYIQTIKKTERENRKLLISLTEKSNECSNNIISKLLEIFIKINEIKQKILNGEKLDDITEYKDLICSYKNIDNSKIQKIINDTKFLNEWLNNQKKYKIRWNCFR